MSAGDGNTTGAELQSPQSQESLPQTVSASTGDRAGDSIPVSSPAFASLLDTVFLGENSSSSGQANETVHFSDGVPLGASTSHQN